MEISNRQKSHAGTPYRMLWVSRVKDKGVSELLFARSQSPFLAHAMVCGRQSARCTALFRFVVASSPVWHFANRDDQLSEGRCSEHLSTVANRQRCRVAVGSASWRTKDGWARAPPRRSTNDLSESVAPQLLSTRGRAKESHSATFDRGAISQEGLDCRLLSRSHVDR